MEAIEKPNDLWKGNSEKMKIEDSWSKTADKTVVEKTMKALKASGIDAVFVKTRDDARKEVLKLIPKGSQVMAMTSETLRLSGIADEIDKSKDYKSAKKAFSEGKLGESDKRKLGAAPDYVVGSVHAVTQDGKVLIASATGSQLPAYAYGSKKVIWVVGTQKIVKTTDEGIKRIYDYTFPLENARARIAYGMDSFVSKILIVNKEFQAGRISLIFIDEAIGF